jgi:hypothetical protein
MTAGYGNMLSMGMGSSEPERDVLADALTIGHGEYLLGDMHVYAC